MKREPSLGPEGFAAHHPVSRETLVRLSAYVDLLQRWSGHLNLVGRSTLADPWRRHILDSAQLLPLVPAGATSLIDLGSGAGFPGLVLAILGVPGVELIEADSRKCAFLREAARVAGVPLGPPRDLPRRRPESRGAGVIIHPRRIEAVPPHVVAVVTARGLAPLDRLLAFAEPFLGPATLCLFLKGERVAEELTGAHKAWNMTVAHYASLSDPRGVILRVSEITGEPRPQG